MDAESLPGADAPTTPALASRVLHALLGSSIEAERATVRTEHRLSQAIAGVRAVLAVFPVLTAAVLWSRVSEPFLVAVAALLIVVDAVVLCRYVARGRILSPGWLVPIDVAASLVIMWLAAAGSGSLSSDRAMYGFLPYLLGTAGLCGLVYPWKYRGAALTGVLAISWWFAAANDSSQLQHLGEFLGYWTWFLVVSAVGQNFRDLALDVDEARDRERAAQQRQEEATRRWFHDDVVRLLESAGSGRLTDAERRQCAITAGQARRELLDDHRFDIESVSAAVDRLRALSSELQLNVIQAPYECIIADPRDARVVDRIFRAAEVFLGNVKRHADTVDATVSILSRPDAMVVTVEDSGKGFDPTSVVWSPNTQRALEAICGVGGTAHLDHAQVGSGVRWILEWHDGDHD